MFQVEEASQALKFSASECPIDLGQVHNDFNLVCAAADPETLWTVTKQLSILVRTLVPQSLDSMSDVAIANTLAALTVLPVAQEVWPTHSESAGVHET